MLKHHVGRLVLTVGLIALVAASAFANNDVVRLRLNTALRYITMGWFHDATGHAAEAVKAAPQDAEARLFLGLLQQVEGQGETALWQYDLAMQLDPNMSILTVFMGDIRLSQGRNAEAIHLYRQALAADASLGLAHYGLGRALERQHDPAAMNAYKDGIGAAPDLVDMRYRYGRLLREDGQYETALEHLLHANLVDPGLAHVRFELGLTYEAMSSYSAAEHEYRTALRLDPEHERARSRLAALPTM